jgi:hypothetical protein
MFLLCKADASGAYGLFNESCFLGTRAALTLRSPCTFGGDAALPNSWAYGTLKFRQQEIFYDYSGWSAKPFKQGQSRFRVRIIRSPSKPTRSVRHGCKWMLRLRMPTGIWTCATLVKAAKPCIDTAMHLRNVGRCAPAMGNL